MRVASHSEAATENWNEPNTPRLDQSSIFGVNQLYFIQDKPERARCSKCWECPLRDCSRCVVAGFSPGRLCRNLAPYWTKSNWESKPFTDTSMNSFTVTFVLQQDYSTFSSRSPKIWTSSWTVVQRTRPGTTLPAASERGTGDVFRAQPARTRDLFIYFFRRYLTEQVNWEQTLIYNHSLAKRPENSKNHPRTNALKPDGQIESLTPYCRGLLVQSQGLPVKKMHAESVSMLLRTLRRQSTRTGTTSDVVDIIDYWSLYIYFNATTQRKGPGCALHHRLLLKEEMRCGGALPLVLKKGNIKLMKHPGSRRSTHNQGRGGFEILVMEGELSQVF